MSDPRGATSTVFIGGVTGGFPHPPLARAIQRVLDGEAKEATIVLTFLPPGAMQELNRETFGHDRPTDVIAFALPQPGATLVGDIYVSRAVAAASAHQHGCTLREELLRLAIHGTLHVLGWDHPEGAARLKSPMWQQQERYLQEVAS